jgi:hypothetical protein
MIITLALVAVSAAAIYLVVKNHGLTGAIKALQADAAAAKAKLSAVKSEAIKLEMEAKAEEKAIVAKATALFAKL